MTWRVLLFAHLRETFGPSIVVEAEPNVEAVLAALKAAGVRTEASRLAADDEFLLPGDSLTPGQQLSLIPPVSGG